MSSIAPYSFHNADKVMLSKAEMEHMYEASQTVASPRGDSLDGFRHYEATLAGSVPILAAHHSHVDWPWNKHGIRPLGWLFPSLDNKNTVSLDPTAPSDADAIWLMTQFSSSWAEMAPLVKQMGEEESNLRAGVSLAWYKTCVEDMQKRVVSALAS